METLYLDVYFLINFTVDMLAIYFSAKICRIKCSMGALVFSGAISALCACFTVLLDPPFALFAVLFLLSALLTVITVARGVGAHRIFKLVIGIAVLEALFGGIVSWIYSALDNLLLPYITEQIGGAENKKLLLASMVVLIAIGIIKLTFKLFSASSKATCVEMSVMLEGETANFSALVDTGNLLTDPMSGRDVVIVKYKALSELLQRYGGESVFKEPCDVIKRKMRIIPTRGVDGASLMYGFIADRLSLISDKRKEQVDAVIAVDFSDGDYGGYSAIAPNSIIR